MKAEELQKQLEEIINGAADLPKGGDNANAKALYALIQEQLRTASATLGAIALYERHVLAPKSPAPR